MAALGSLGSSRALSTRRSVWGVCPFRPAQPVVRLGLGDLFRPAAAPTTTVLCSSLRKERKKMAKVLKSHRKALEKRLRAVATADVDSPVLSELLLELRTLNDRLAGQRAAALLYTAGEESGSESSDSDEECEMRSLAAASRRATAMQQVADPATAAAVIATASSTTLVPNENTLVVSGRLGTVEVEVPAPPQGWDWDEEEYRARSYEGQGRIMVCQGGKCQRKGATEVLGAVSALAASSPGIEVVPCKCVGACSKGAAIKVRQQGARCATYTQLTPAQLPDIFDAHFSAPPPPAVPAVAAVAVPAIAAAPVEAVAVPVSGHGHGHELARQAVLAAVVLPAEPCCVACSVDSL